MINKSIFENRNISISKISQREINLLVWRLRRIDEPKIPFPESKKMKLNDEHDKSRLAALERLKASVEFIHHIATNHTLKELRTCPVVDQLRELLTLQLLAIEQIEALDIADVSQAWIDLERKRFLPVEKAFRTITVWQLKFNETQLGQSGKTNQTGLHRKPIPKRRRR